jgi:cytoskeleton protein RodZ
MAALGDRFRAAREARGLSLSDVSEQIRIRSVYLAAIEDENWKAIGAAVYVRGFLRTYARFLGLDPEEVVTAFNGAVRPSEEAAPAPLPSRERPSKRGSLMVWIAAAVAMVLVAYVFYNALTMRREAAPIASQSAAASPLPSIVASPSGARLAASPVSSAQPSAPGGSADGPKSLALVLSAPSWLRVTVDGSVSMEGTFPAGTSKTFHGKNALVRIGNAGGVEIYVNGKDVGKLGRLGDVAERAFTL